MLTLHILGHTWVLNGWQATLATGVIAFHDIVLYPLVFLFGKMFGKEVKPHGKGKRIYKRRKGS